MQKYVKVADGVHQECHIKYRTIVGTDSAISKRCGAEKPAKELVFSEPEVRHLQQQPNGSSIVNAPHYVRISVFRE